MACHVDVVNGSNEEVNINPECECDSECSETERKDDFKLMSTLDSLSDISSQFFEMVSVRRMKWKDADAEVLVSSPELQRRLLKMTVEHPLCRVCPPSLSYRRYFMKMFIHKLESEDADIADEVYEAYTNLLSCSEDEDESLCFKSYFLPWGESISLQESVHLVSQGTTGLSTWQAAQHLAEWISENRHIVATKSVLELGCGLGFTGITLSKSFPSIESYTFTDCHKQVLQLLSRNIERNLASGTCSCCPTKPVKDNAVQTPDSLGKPTVVSPTSVSCDAAQPSDNLCPDSKTDDDSETDSEHNSSSSSDQISRCDEQSCLALSERADSLTVDPQFWREPTVTELDPLSESPDEAQLSPAGELAVLRQDSRIRLGLLDWEAENQTMLGQIAADVILAADVVYDLSIIPSLVSVLKSLLQSKLPSGIPPVAYVASTIRNEDTRDEFLIAMVSQGLDYTVVEGPREQLYFYDRSVPIEILAFTAS